MASSDEPPCLSIGTEVSAKYRGAFCEATIKIAKKLVKCKVSYTKGQTAMVNNDVIKGPLKAGSQVEVKQPDGQFLMATINKLTDQSTYTVVFDDGDERTLKRSSLCLQGARHFHVSESLDNQPLTDPENFGAPVKKSGRKRRRLSPGSSQEESSVKKKCAYPPEFPVGKAVFLENDRRRSCWLPAVIVPAHYVMDESEMTPDTICLRSFKDGRFFAATQNELHDFSPDKEPLLSMLEGEIQAMYMCKPAIERATAYLDTGELPWDMDLFDKNTERPSPLRPRDCTSSEQEDTITPEDREDFMQRYTSFLESKGTPLSRPAMVGQKELDLHRLYKMVNEIGGMDRVTQEMKWRSIYLRLGMPPTTTASYAISRAYKKYLNAFELFEKGKGAKVGKEASKQSRKRLAVAIDNCEEDQQQKQQQQPPKSEKVEEKVLPKITRNTKIERIEPRINLEKMINSSLEKAKALPRVDKQKLESPKVNRSDKPVKQVKPVTKEVKAGSKEDDTRSRSTEVKSEISDQEGSMIENSINGDEARPDERRVGVRCPGGYAENDNVLVWYGKGKSLKTYQAKIQSIDKSSMGRTYLVHYNGWNNRYNEWIEEQRLAGKVTGEPKPSRPLFSKKKNKRQKPPSTPRTTESTTPSPAPSPATPTSIPITTPSSIPPNDGNGPQKLRLKEEPKEQSLKKTPQLPKPVAANGNIAVKKPRAKKRNRSLSEANICSPPSPELIEAISLDVSPPKTPRLSPPTEQPTPPPPKPAEPSINPASRTSWVEPTPATPSSEPAPDLDEGIQVKREESWDSPRGSTSSSIEHGSRSTSSSSGHGSLSSGGSESGEEVVPRGLGGLAAVAAAANALVIAEKVPDTARVVPRPLERVESDLSVDGLSVLATQASQATLSTHGTPTTNSSVDSLRNPSGNAPSTQEPPQTTAPSLPPNSDSSNGYETEDSLYADRKSPDNKPSSDKEMTPPMEINERGKRKSPVGKRKYAESEEDYEARKMARRAELNFKIDFSQLPEMNRGERTVLIQHKIRELQSRWMELRSEVAYLERKKRRARRKERDTARLQATTSSTQTATPPSTEPPPQAPSVHCH